jgi:diguanylate cyclase (GGDEF)-like protein
VRRERLLRVPIEARDRSIESADPTVGEDAHRTTLDERMRGSVVGVAARAAILVLGVSVMTGVGVMIAAAWGLSTRASVVWAIVFGGVAGSGLSIVLMLMPAARAARDRRRMIERIEAVAAEEREASFETLLAIDAHHELSELARTVHDALAGAHADRLEAARLRREMNAMVEREARKHVAHLTTLSMTDELTGLANRRGFEQGLAQMVDRAKADGTELALLAIDLDNFKRLNDTCGHQKGDEALSVAGDLLQAHVRERDLAGRMGGDELFIALCGVDGRRAEAVADRLIRLFASHPLANQPAVPWPTMSVGIALLREDRCRDASELRLYADQALYASKRGGRARATRYGAAA